MLRDGEVKECPDPKWRAIAEHILIESQVSDLHGRKSLEAQCLDKVKKRLRDQYKAVAEAANMPRGLMHDEKNITDSSDDDKTTATCAQCNSPSNSTCMTTINFNELLTKN
jgi:hypothetical protein